ncbi:MAG TPA: succinyl-diaminopimelate desuccinylase [Acidimicrobiales bacterium]|nr:succinyl-diaminopimelate desuccinylase [Acidimicrobiales bacterium]
MTDLLALTAELVAIPSVSHHESALADRVEAELRAVDHLEVLRLGDSVVARTRLGRDRRVVLAGHLDTVPPFGDAGGRLEGDTVWGLGAVDMKGGLAVLLDLATTLSAPALDVTYVLYACEEVAHEHNALARLATTRPDLLAADAAVLGEPTAGVVEAGCQGTIRAVVSTGGRRAHTARPWMGLNAVHRMAPVLGVLQCYVPRGVVIDGCEYTEQLQAVGIDGGVAANVVPDRAALTINYRFAPDADTASAQRTLRSLFDSVLDPSAGDAFDIVDAASGAPPALGHPVLGALVAASGAPARAKLGWTDVSTFAAIGVPATNFGPGDPLLAHTSDEHVSRPELERVRDVLASVLLTG